MNNSIEIVFERTDLMVGELPIVNVIPALDEVVELNEKKPPSPLNTVALEIDLVSIGDRIELRYMCSEKRKFESEKDVKEYMYKLVSRSQQISSAGTLGLPYESPLSFNAKDDCYVILLLKNKKNWQFMNKASPVKVEKSKIKYYHKARRLKVNGGRLVEIKGGADQQECRGAYFIAEAASDIAVNGEPLSTKFNIYVELTYVNRDGESRNIPIIIDPDVRHPGGHG